jgi:hypothetical protein
MAVAPERTFSTGPILPASVSMSNCSSSFACKQPRAHPPGSLLRAHPPDSLLRALGREYPLHGRRALRLNPTESIRLGP